MVIVCAGAIFLLIPQRDVAISPNAQGGNTTQSRDSDGPASGASNPAAPYADSQLDRARKEAEGVLDEFSSLQDTFEKNQYGNDEHVDRYNSILDRANNGDTLFGERKFDLALNEYKTSVDEIGQLLEDIDTDFEHWMQIGDAALEERDTELAHSAFSKALDIKPMVQSAKIQLQRVAQLPKINELLRESERAELRNQWTTALDFLDQAEVLDPQTRGIDERRNRIQVAQAQEDTSNMLTFGHQALNRNDFDEADSWFNSVLEQNPDNQAAKSGLQQSAISRVAQRIAGLQERAEQEEANLNLVAALATYNEVLEIDDKLEFAVQGKERVTEIIVVSRQMQTILRDPDSLSADEKFDQATQFLEIAENHRGHSAEYDRALREFADLVDYASQYLPVVLLSDNLTEVTLTTQGLLGSFDRHELQLRPGRYELVGSRDGYVDVRKTIKVGRDMEPASIVCETQI